MQHLAVTFAAVLLCCSATAARNVTSGATQCLTPHTLHQYMENMVQPFVDMMSLGETYNKPASSCKEIKTQKAEAVSGYYWIRTHRGTAVQAYCDMEVDCKGSKSEGWMRLIDFDMSLPENLCPCNLTKFTDNNVIGCKKANEACSSIILPTLGIEYSKICGMAIGYQWGKTDAFQFGRSPGCTIDDAYVDGISITQGWPRKHVWTLAAAQHEVFSTNPLSLCPCTNRRNRFNSLINPPAFVGTDYFCDTGSDETAVTILFDQNPLWDGEGCGLLNECCNYNNPSWFCKSMDYSSSEDLEVRVCSNEGEEEENIILEKLKIFVQ